MIKGFIFFVAGALSFIALSPPQLNAENIFLTILFLAVMVIGLESVLANFHLGKPRESIKPGEYLIISITDIIDASTGEEMYYMILTKNIPENNKGYQFCNNGEYHFYILPKKIINNITQFKPDRLRIIQASGLTKATLL